MSKRNFTLLIIVLVVIVIIVFAFLFYRKAKNTTPGDGTNFPSFWNPFGGKRNPVTPDPGDGNEPVPDPTPVEEFTLKLRKISSMPIAGYGVFLKERYKEVPPEETKTGESTTEDSNIPLPTPTKTVTKKPSPPQTEFMPALRYVERSTGNIYQTFADNIMERRFTSSIIPKIYEAVFGTKSESVVMRYLNQRGVIETFAGVLPKELLGADGTGDNEVKGSFLPENITDMALSSDLSKLFYLFGAGSGSVGVVSDTTGNGKTQVFNSPFTEWLSYWPSAKTITLTTKPSANVLGYMYKINLDRKDFSRVLGGINGLTTLMSPNEKFVLYTDNGMYLSIYDTTTKNSFGLSVQTMPEKCTWNKTSDVLYCFVPRTVYRNSYPDAWYQGEVVFSDQISKINIASRAVELLADPLSISEEIDGIKLSLDKDENYLFFVNKIDSYLWEFILK